LFERDLGLASSENLQRFALEWQPLARHELAGSYFASSRSGFQQIQHDFTFRNSVYPVDALVTTGFDLKYWSATYTYWARRGARDGFGITLGAAGLSLDASVIAQSGRARRRAGPRRAERPPPADALVSTLPRVTISGYTGRALTGNARLEYRIVRWLGVGAAYNCFRLDVDVARPDLRAAIHWSAAVPAAGEAASSPPPMNQTARQRTAAGRRGCRCPLSGAHCVCTGAGGV